MSKYKSNNEYVREKKIKEMNKEEVVEYYESKIKIFNLLFVFMILLIYVFAGCYAYEVISLKEEMTEQKQETTAEMGGIICATKEAGYHFMSYRGETNGRVVYSIECRDDIFKFEVK